MYLVHTESLEVEYFPESTSIQYAILSHRWEREEVTLQDLQNNTARTKYGYEKFQKTCQQAKKEGLKYVWIDNCCIDKTSSAELSEAINSMFNWYRDATICLAYLADVDDVKAIKGSVWFTRGWTLQELIAPRKMYFFGTDWIELGDKTALSDTLSRITGVPTNVLNGQESFTRLSVAQRMSWQAGRQTTRTEDIAYSLMGIMDVNMPLLYGEGIKAFRRLQEEIIKQTDDHTIFAWHLTGDDDTASGLLAPSPKAFAGCSTLFCREPTLSSSAFALTNRGLSIQLPLIRWSHNFRVALLNCVLKQKGLSGNGRTVGIFVRPLDAEDGQYARVTLGGQDRVLFDGDCFKSETLSFRRDAEMIVATFHLRKLRGPLVHKLAKTKTTPDAFESHVLKPPKSLYFRQNPLDFRPLKLRGSYGFWFRKFVPFHKTSVFDPEKDMSIRCWNLWDYDKRVALVPEGCSGAAFIIHVQGKEVEALSGRTPAESSSAASNHTPQDLLSGTDAKSITMPSMLLVLGYTARSGGYDSDLSGYQVSGALKTDPTAADLAWTTNAKSDSEALSNVPWDIATRSKFNTHNKKSFHTWREYWNLFISERLVEGTVMQVVDLLWSGRQSQCDECGKIITKRMYICLQCSQYDCCLECFKILPQTQHDANVGNRQHLFHTLLLGPTSGEGYSVIDDEQKRRLEKPA